MFCNHRTGRVFWQSCCTILCGGPTSSGQTLRGGEEDGVVRGTFKYDCCATETVMGLSLSDAQHGSAVRGKLARHFGDNLVGE